MSDERSDPLHRDHALLLDQLRCAHHTEPVADLPPQARTLPLIAAWQPADTDDLRQMVRTIAEHDTAIFPIGGATALDFGNPPSREGVGLVLTGLDRVIDYPARDMTITVEAGITMARLDELLRAEGQRLPVDVPQADRATLGGAIATNTSGPRRYALGTLRDYVIGISVVDADGNLTKAGGRVVKNVAGYDLCKLYTGSLGTLGIIAQVTLKLKPRPEDRVLIGFDLPSAEAAAEALSKLVTSRTRPVCIELFNRPALKLLPDFAPRLPASSDWMLLVGFEESTPVVRWQEDVIVQELAEFEPRHVVVLPARSTSDPWQPLIEFPALDAGPLSFKANLLSSAIVDFFELAGRQDATIALEAHAASGIAVGHLLGDVSLDQAAAILSVLRQHAVQSRGNLVVLCCPPDWKRQLPVWGEARPDWPFMKSLKQALDPRGIFNPGRFVDGT